ncbi:secretion protein F [Tepidibacter hydrothermalis]|uniref:Secretion protein F n=1 Tax=Tepidibacter hydrothermalis TaxID=3036126 RepID=A0ABY8ED48_9FIRM|nr:secretion protein F [Tepidibacter hydrothermalis]WFD10863.1 secretion protein F [Tepidibacter hydrothermalis]
MIPILIIFASIFTLGAYLIFADLLKLPTRKVTKAVLAINRREKKKSKNFEMFINELSMKLSKFSKLTDYNRRKISATLKSANIKLSPETFIARAWVKAGLTLLFIVPAFLIFPIIFPLILFLAVAVYFKEIRCADEAVRKRREDIEFELPRFVSTLTQELKASRNVLSILETYKQNAGKSFKNELEITVADMKSGSYESALTRLEARLGSSQLSDVVRGLIGVIRGDDGVVYFQMLSHDLKQLELQRLKTIAMKRPSKIRKYSFAMLFCFLLMYLSVMFVEIVKTLGKMF